MKKIFTLLIGIVFSITILKAQAPPQAFSYKATITKTLPSGTTAAVVNKTIGLKIVILQGDPGIPAYSETFKPITNSSGQIDIVIGKGTTPQGDFSLIEWSEDIFFLQVWVDINGGTAYGTTPMSTTQLLSVPFAMYAGKAGSAVNETDPVFSLHPAHGISSDDITNWDITGWAEVKNKPTTIAGFGITDAVTTIGDQTIFGNKTFTGNTTVPNALHAGNGFASIYSETEKRPILGERGNVSIGTASNWDWSELDVNGGINILPGQWEWGSGLALSAWDAKGGGGDQYLIGSTGAKATEGPGKFFIRNTNHYWDAIFLMDDAGNVGIGLGFGLPKYKLDVGGDINFTGNLYKNGNPFSPVSSWSEITNKPTFATVATSGSYNDLNNIPTIDGSETKLTEGTNVTVTGAGTVASPYVINSTGGGGSSSHSIGETYGGGIVFYVYDNGQHGLIAATVDQSTEIRWYGGSYTNTRARADGAGAGLKNTAIIIANQGPVDGNAFAATVCNEYSVTVGGVTYGDWYLPSKYELNLLYLQKSVVGGFASSNYCSSTEYSANFAWRQNFGNGDQGASGKFGPYYVRAVRAF